MKAAILTRSYNSTKDLIDNVNKASDDKLLTVIEFPKPVTLNKKRYNLLKRLDINAYRIVRKAMHSKNSEANISLNINKYVIDKLDSKSVRDILIKEEIDLLLLKNAPVLSEKFLNNINCKVINAHSGYLPDYKGASCGLWPLVENDEKIGVTLHEVIPELDAGRIIKRSVIDLNLIPRSLNYPKSVNELQIKELSVMIAAYLNNEIDESAFEANPANSKYFPLPGFTDFVKGYFNLLKIKK